MATLVNLAMGFSKTSLLSFKLTQLATNRSFQLLMFIRIISSTDERSTFLSLNCVCLSAFTLALCVVYVHNSHNSWIGWLWIGSCLVIFNPLSLSFSKLQAQCHWQTACTSLLTLKTLLKHARCCCCLVL